MGALGAQATPSILNHNIPIVVSLSFAFLPHLCVPSPAYSCAAAASPAHHLAPESCRPRMRKCLASVNPMTRAFPGTGCPTKHLLVLYYMFLLSTLISTSPLSPPSTLCVR